MEPNNTQPGGAGSPEPQDLYKPVQSAQLPQPVVPAPQPQPMYQPVAPQQPLAQPQVPQELAADNIMWEASEYMQRNKDIMWTIGFGVVTLLFIGVAVWLQAWTFVALVVVMAVAIGVYAFRKPRTLQYRITPQGVSVGDKVHEFSEFRAFGVREEEAFYSVMLIPVKRLMPAVRMYFAEDDGEKIVDLLSEYLPMEDLPPDPFEDLMRRLHF